MNEGSHFCCYIPQLLYESICVRRKISTWKERLDVVMLLTWLMGFHTHPHLCGGSLLLFDSLCNKLLELFRHGTLRHLDMLA